MGIEREASGAVSKDSRTVSCCFSTKSTLNEYYQSIKSMISQHFQWKKLLRFLLLRVLQLPSGEISILIHFVDGLVHLVE